MLELQQPLQMPHALSSERLPPPYRPWPDTNIPYRSSGQKSGLSSELNPPYLHPAESAKPQPVTPPFDMSGPVGNFASSMNLRNGDHRYSLRPLGLPNPTSAGLSFPNYYGPNMSIRQPAPVLPPASSSPASQRSNTLIENSNRTSPSRTTALIPALEIPNDIKAPQETISDLAAEVCTFGLVSGIVED
jgi:hypothetical protein